MNAPEPTRARKSPVDTGEVKSAARSLELLELFAAHRDGLTLGEVCVLTGWPKSSTLALLRTLRAHDYLSDGSRDHAYRLGHRVAWLGASYLDGINLVQEGLEIVRRVSRQCDETVHLATLRGPDVHYLVKEEGSSHMRMVSAVGTTFPAHGTGVGKTLLSGLSSRTNSMRSTHPEPSSSRSRQTRSPIGETCSWNSPRSGLVAMPTTAANRPLVSNASPLRSVTPPVTSSPR